MRQDPLEISNRYFNSSRDWGELMCKWRKMHAIEGSDTAISTKTLHLQLVSLLSKPQLTLHLNYPISYFRVPLDTTSRLGNHSPTQPLSMVRWLISYDATLPRSIQQKLVNNYQHQRLVSASNKPLKKPTCFNYKSSFLIQIPRNSINSAIPCQITWLCPSCAFV
jgi:hypothetical protein